MHALKLALTASALVMLLAFPVSSLSAEPQGELYWKVDGDTSDFYSLYNEDDPPTPYYGEYTYGAFDALDHACEQSTINGTYIDDKVRVIILISTEVTGYCRVMTGGYFLMKQMVLIIQPIFTVTANSVPRETHLPAQCRLLTQTTSVFPAKNNSRSFFLFFR